MASQNVESDVQQFGDDFETRLKANSSWDAQSDCTAVTVSRTPSICQEDLPGGGAAPGKGAWNQHEEGCVPLAPAPSFASMLPAPSPRLHLVGEASCSFATTPRVGAAPVAPAPSFAATPRDHIAPTLAPAPSFATYRSDVAPTLAPAPSFATSRDAVPSAHELERVEVDMNDFVPDDCAGLEVPDDWSTAIDFSMEANLLKPASLDVDAEGASLAGSAQSEEMEGRDTPKSWDGESGDATNKPGQATKSRSRSMSGSFSRAWASIKQMALLICMIGYVLVSIGLTFFNKWLLAVHGFSFPVLIVMADFAAVFLFSVGVCVFCYRREIAASDYSPTKITFMTFLREFAYVGVSVAADTLLTQITLITTTITMVEVVKSGMPVLVLLFGLCRANREHVSRSKIGVVLTISLGILLTSLGKLSADLLGMLAASAATICAALRLVFMEGVLRKGSSNGQKKINSFLALAYVLPSGIISLFVMLIPIEGNHVGSSMWFNSVRGIENSIEILTMHCAMGILLRVFEVLVISKGSALTICVLGICKMVIEVGLSIVIFGDPVSPVNFVGVAISILGAAWYNMADSQERASKAAASAGLNEALAGETGGSAAATAEEEEPTERTSLLGEHRCQINQPDAGAPVSYFATLVKRASPSSLVGKGRSPVAAEAPKKDSPRWPVAKLAKDAPIFPPASSGLPPLVPSARFRASSVASDGPHVPPRRCRSAHVVRLKKEEDPSGTSSTGSATRANEHRGEHCAADRLN